MGLNKEEALKKINETEGDVAFEVCTEPEHSTNRDNFATAEVDKRIREKTKAIHSQYDNDFA